MTTISQLTSELSNLVSECRRRNPELRALSEASLAVLKTYTGSAALAEAEFLQQTVASSPSFVTPFIDACHTGNTKYVAIATQCLNRLITAHALPEQRLVEVVEALGEATKLAVEIQLKVLQSLTALLQGYTAVIDGPLEGRMLQLCALLLSANKAPVVASTAGAAFLQLVLMVFEKVNVEDATLSEAQKSYPLLAGDETVVVGPAAHDAYRLLLDLVTLTPSPQFLPFTFETSETFRLELLENILLNHALLFIAHAELAQVLRIDIVPLLLRGFSSSKQFAVVVRVARLLLLLLKSLLPLLTVECEVVLSMLVYALGPESASPEWKKLLALEVFHGILSNFEFVKAIFETYHTQQKPNASPPKPLWSNYFSAVETYLELQRPLLHVSLTLMPPEDVHSAPGSVSLSGPHPVVGVSVSGSTIKVAYLDLLDKAAPPATTPPSYGVYVLLSSLNALLEGALVYIQGLHPEGHAPVTATIVTTTTLISTIAPSVASMNAVFLYSALDNVLFRLLVRSVQKFANAAGLLGLTEPRDRVLHLLAEATIVTAPITKPQEGYSLSSIVGSISSTLLQHPVPQEDPAFYHPRVLHQRNVTCFKALVNLAIALGPRLREEWRTVLVTLQWMDYYLHGVTEAELRLDVKQAVPPPPELGKSDLVSAQKIVGVLENDLKLYGEAGLYDFLHTVCELSDTVLGMVRGGGGRGLMLGGREPLTSRGESCGTGLGGTLEPCVFNHQFYFKTLSRLAQSPLSFLTSDRNWELMMNYHIKTGTDRGLAPETRMLVVESFSTAVKTLAEFGFGSSLPGNTERMTLTPLMGFIAQQLVDVPEELRALGTEIEVALRLLETLQTLLDRYGMFYKNSWDVVFKILASPFRFNTEGGEAEALQEKLRMLIVSAFETLTLVMDEFLDSLSPTQARILVDCLHHFNSQKLDLNISFSAISYFWSLSDHLRTQASHHNRSTNALLGLSDTKSLIDAIAGSFETPEEKSVALDALWVYLLHVLVKVFQDTRQEVRNGSIQTFFRIIDSHGKYLPSWRVISLTVLPGVFQLTMPPDSLELMLQGYSSMLAVYLPAITLEGLYREFWLEVLEYIERVFAEGSTEVSIVLFTALRGLLECFKATAGRGDGLERRFFTFWLLVQVSYTHIANPGYQTFLVAYMASFKPLYEVNSELTTREVARLLLVFSACARYPILPEMASDRTRCTDLQELVLTNIALLDTRDVEVKALVLQLLGALAVLPLATRSRLLKKVGDKSHARVPTFQAISVQTVALLRAEFAEPFPLHAYIRNGSLLQLMGLLIEPIRLEAAGELEGQHELWLECLFLMVTLARRVSKAFDTDEVIGLDSKEALWAVILETLRSCLSPGSHSESVGVKAYTELRDIVFPGAVAADIGDEALAETVRQIWQTSFFYSQNEIETEIYETEGLTGSTAALVGFSFDDNYGSTTPVNMLPNVTLRQTCLADLVVFALGAKGQRVLEVAHPYLLNRAAFALRRFVADERLLNRSPLPKLQQAEFSTILKGLNELAKCDQHHRLSLLSPILLRCLPYAGRIPGGLEEIENLFRGIM